MADWKTIRPLLLAALATAAAGALGALAYIKSGIYDVGAAKPHTKFTEWVTHETMIHSEMWDVVAWLEASRRLPSPTFAAWSGRCEPIARPAPARPAIPRP